LALPDEQARSRSLAHARFLIRSSFFACACLLDCACPVDCAGVFACACLLPLVLGAGRCTIASGRQRQHVDVRDARSGIEVSPK
jgi:hypothetical protein